MSTPKPYGRKQKTARRRHTGPVRAAYADPPYPGLEHYYEGSRSVDPAELFAQLSQFDAWAVSCDVGSLKVNMAAAPEGARVAAWCKPNAPLFCVPAYSWEPVIYWRPARGDDRMHPGREILRDYTVCPTPNDDRKFIGRKPFGFCVWVFKLMGLELGDELVDLYPGSGAVGEAWKVYVEERVKLRQLLGGD